jgi:hypothetical protein
MNCCLVEGNARYNAHQCLKDPTKHGLGFGPARLSRASPRVTSLGLFKYRCQLSFCVRWCNHASSDGRSDNLEPSPADRRSAQILTTNHLSSWTIASLPLRPLSPAISHLVLNHYYFPVFGFFVFFFLLFFSTWTYCFAFTYCVPHCMPIASCLLSSYVFLVIYLFFLAARWQLIFMHSLLLLLSFFISLQFLISFLA